MAINKKADSKKSQMTEKPSRTTATRTSAKSVADKANSSSEREKLEQLIQKGFHPTAVKFLKEEMGIDLYSLPISTVYDIKSGRVTEPINVRVTPLVYDKENKEVRQMTPIQSIASLRFIFPYGDSFEPVALDKEHRVYVASYPCHEYIQKADPSEAGAAQPEPVSEEKANKELPKFSAAQVMALESIGINENRLYANAYNSLDIDTKRSIAAGEAFEVNGYVKTSFGVLNICGQGKIVDTGNGTWRAKFESNEPETPGKNSILDINSVRRCGNLEFDFFERDSKGKIKTDIFDLPILNKAGRDLVTYGVSFEPVDGYLHKNIYDAKERRFKDEIEKDKYQVSVVNGGLCATKMKKVNDLDKDGNQIKTTFNGKEVNKYHYEIAELRINSDGTVRVGSENLRFKSEEDLMNYKKGLGGVVEGATWQEYGQKGSKPKEIKYDAYVVPDNQKNGFAKAFSPSTSKKLQEQNAPVKKVVKKQNFSIGF